MLWNPRGREPVLGQGDGEVLPEKVPSADLVNSLVFWPAKEGFQEGKGTRMGKSCVGGSGGNWSGGLKSGMGEVDLDWILKGKPRPGVKGG